MTHIILRHFLPPETDAAVRALASNESLYGPATVTGDATWRSGRVAHIEGRPEARAVAEAVLRAVPGVCYALRVDEFAPSRCEVQMSCYGEGDKFRPHTDNGSPDAATRVLSWVIYLDLVTPRQWWGVLKFGDEVIVPEDGMAIFFPSGEVHEVGDVMAPDEWAARRHTVNGWVRG
jgi:SM-20-related protein